MNGAVIGVTEDVLAVTFQVWIRYSEFCCLLFPVLSCAVCSSSLLNSRTLKSPVKKCDLKVPHSPIFCRFMYFVLDVYSHLLLIFLVELDR